MCVSTVSLEVKRQQALDYLGTNWILHPDYSRAKNPHHSLSHRHSARLTQYCAELADLRTGRRKASKFLRT